MSYLMGVSVMYNLWWNKAVSVVKTYEVLDGFLVFDWWKVLYRFMHEWMHQNSACKFMESDMLLGNKYGFFTDKARRKFYVSKLVTDWKTWPWCIFFFLSSKHVKFELVTSLFSMKYETWFLDEQDIRQNTELKKFVVQRVLLCLSCLFMYILTSKLIKNWKEKTASK